jgi:glycosyltransferase involved in cell wall biosynthesis
MRIVNAMFGCRLGGLEQVFLDYCEALALAGHEVHALIHPRAAVRAVLERRETRFHAVSNLNAFDPLAMLRLRLWLGKVRSDVTIAHGNRAVSLLKGAFVRPLIGVAQNYQLKCRGLDAVLCATEDLRRHCRSLADVRLCLIPNAVHALPALPARLWRDPPVIGAMGRFVAKKGFDVLIEALRLLVAAGVPFRAVLAGDGVEKGALRRLATHSGLEQHLEFPGWENDKQRFFGSIDIFCLPSLHEPFGVVLLEAMAHGLPVIATDSEGPSEIIAHQCDGVIVPKGNAVALAEALALILRDPSAARQIGGQAYETVRRKYDLPLLSARLDHAVRAMPGAAAGPSAHVETPGTP